MDYPYRMWKEFTLKWNGEDSEHGPWDVHMSTDGTWMAEVKAQGDYDIGLPDKIYTVRTGSESEKEIPGNELVQALADLQESLSTPVTAE